MKSLFTISLCIFALAANAETISLEQALTLARANRPAVKAAELRVQEARFSSRGLGSKPGITFGIGQSTDPRRGLGATDEDLFVKQSFDFFGRSQAGRALGEAGVKVAQAELQQTLLAVQTDVMQAYFELAAAAKVQDVSKELLKLAESLLQATTRRYEEGKIPEVQLSRAKIEFARAKQSAILREAQRVSAQRRFEGTLGSTKTELSADATASLVDVTAPQLEGRPDIMRLNAEMAVATAEGIVAQRSNRPEVELVALRSPWGQDSARIGARLQLTVPLTDGGRSRSERQSASAKLAAITSSRLDAMNLARAEVAAIQIEIAAEEQVVANYKDLQIATRSLVEKSQRGFGEGIGTMLDVLEATRALREVEQELAEADLALNTLRVKQHEVSGVLLGVSK
ncbi:MAG: TolC family protein [Armatimonadetes bacterium]|nr:TolC family protein [Armatimonadota bacterium]